MIDFNAINNTGDPTALQPTQAEEDKQLFLELLVTQLKSQDPFNPMNNEDFTAQLAQFSSLESLNNIYAELSNNNMLQTSVHNAMSTSLIGNYGVVAGNGVAVNNGEPTAAVFVMPEAGSAKVRIVDEFGNTVRTFSQTNLSGGENTVKWDGKDNDGDVVEDGVYSVEVEMDSGPSAGTQLSVYSAGKIRAVRFVGGAPVIVIDDAQYLLSDLLEVLDELPNANSGNADSGSVDTGGASTDEESNDSNALRTLLGRLK